MLLGMTTKQFLHTNSCPFLISLLQIQDTLFMVCTFVMVAAA
jgi:hypothetical protein